MVEDQGWSGHVSRYTSKVALLLERLERRVELSGGTEYFGSYANLLGAVGGTDSC